MNGETISAMKQHGAHQQQPAACPYWVKMDRPLPETLVVHQTHDAERRQVDDPAHDLVETASAVLARKTLVVSLRRCFFMARPNRQAQNRMPM